MPERIVEATKALCQKFITKVETGREDRRETCSECRALLKMIDEYKPPIGATLCGGNVTFKPIVMHATDIPDAWFQCVDGLFDAGFRYKIQHGSYVDDFRLEFDQIMVTIRYPYAEPYDLMLPKIPAELGVPDPVAPGYIEQYLPHLMTDHVEPNEQYTYGSRMTEQIPYWIGVLKSTPNTNQAILQVGRPDDYHLDDPPCLRHIDMRVKDGVLFFYPYFRSWDLWGGFPANLGGIAVLQKYMADEIGVKAGLICATSKGLHIYKYIEEWARLRVGRQKAAAATTDTSNTVAGLIQKEPV